MSAEMNRRISSGVTVLGSAERELADVGFGGTEGQDRYQLVSNSLGAAVRAVTLTSGRRFVRAQEYQNT